MHYGNGLLVCPKYGTCYNTVSNEIINDFERVVCHNTDTNNYNNI